MKRLTYLFVLLASYVSAQHYQFSQFYAAQTYLNPAFTGANTCPRFSLNYRNQWSAIPGTFTSYQASYDRPMGMGGAGIQFFGDKAGVGGLKTLQFNALGAYGIRLTRDIMSRAGISAGFVQRSIDYSQLRFGDQIGRGGASTTLDDINTNRIVYFDLNMGYLVYAGSYWGGLSLNHLNRPNQSLNGGDSPIPIEMKFHGGYKYLINDDPKDASETHNVTIAGNYKKQNKFNQIDLGVYYTKSYFVLGLWYRGIPVFRPTEWYRNNDALVFLAGYSNEKFQIGYSFDLTISKLQFNNTNGTHEVSLTYLMCSKKKKKKRPVTISCPKF
jgi:type IX secretion system PorP/SprF family membrane protein